MHFFLGYSVTTPGIELISDYYLYCLKDLIHAEGNPSPLVILLNRLSRKLDVFPGSTTVVPTITNVVASQLMESPLKNITQNFRELLSQELPQKGKNMPVGASCTQRSGPQSRGPMTSLPVVPGYHWHFSSCSLHHHRPFPAREIRWTL